MKRETEMEQNKEDHSGLDMRKRTEEKLPLRTREEKSNLLFLSCQLSMRSNLNEHLWEADIKNLLLLAS